MLALRTDINKQTKTTRTINTALPYVIIGLVTLFVIAFVIVIIPSRKHSNVKNKIDYQRDSKNYPIPGVGPLPKVKKKEKQDVIEPEEKTITPLAEFVGKSEESNEELKNRPLEIDDKMFENNPTRGNEEGLININPLAFDSDETEIDDGTQPDTSKKDDDEDIDIL